MYYAVEPSDRESVTQLYLRAAPVAAVSAVVPMPAPLPMVPRLASTTHIVQRVTVGVRTNAMGIGFLATCTVFGVLAGIVIALHGSASAGPSETDDAPSAMTSITVEPIAAAPPAPPARPVVAPMADPPAAPAAAPVAAAPVAAAPVAAAPVLPTLVTVTPVAARRHHHDRAPAANDAEPAAVPAAIVAAAPTTGTLRVSSKPPCAIAIDDKPTGLTTPQAEITLTPGRHEVTLTNAEQGIQLTAAVVISPDHTTPLFQDFTQ